MIKSAVVFVLSVVLTWSIVLTGTEGVKAPSNAWEGRSPLEPVNSAKPRDGFKRLKQAFHFARKPDLGDFGAEALFLGQCISALKPTHFRKSYLAAYIRTDQAFGKIVYLIPEIGVDPSVKLPASITSAREAASVHRAMEKELLKFTSLQEFSPLTAPVLSPVIEKLSGTLLFSKNKEIRKAPLSDSEEPTQFYLVRIRQQEPSSPVLMVEALCSATEGCSGTKQTGVIGFAAPLIHCSYDSSFEFDTKKKD